ncbi:MAG: peptidase S8, partial [Cytophagaceae bacterium]
MKNTSLSGPLALALMASLGLPICGAAQSLNPPTKFNQWSYKDPATDSIPGISLDKAYQLLKGRKSVPVVVGVVDSGIDIAHEDLRDVIWKNPKETPGNNADDDKNGYVDDVNGWNFMGAKDGTTYEADLDEVGQITNDWKAKFEKADPAKLSATEKKQYDIYQKAKAQYAKSNARTNSLRVLVRDEATYKRGMEAMATLLTGKAFERESITNVETGSDTAALGAKNLLTEIFAPQAGSFDNLINRVKTVYDRLKPLVLSDIGGETPPDNARKAVGDDPTNPNERYYGSPKLIIGKSEELAMHGSHVAGIIGAKRGNSVGVDGIADNVRLMMVGVVPSGGDERDKDVANGIRYAVDNGAKVINMSFGKRFSPYKDAVDAAIKYAEEKDVLLVHAAGNNGENVDSLPTYPRPEYEDGTIAKNYMTVGNSTRRLGSALPASSSNYGTRVDLFAPGTDIDATTPHNGYQSLTGTSMA